MTRDEILLNVRKLSEQIKKPIPIEKYKRAQIIREEVVEAFQTPVPNAVTLANGQTKQVEKDNWILIHQDGTQSTYTDEEFHNTFEKVSLGETFRKGASSEK